MNIDNKYLFWKDIDNISTNNFESFKTDISNILKLNTKDESFNFVEDLLPEESIPLEKIDIDKLYTKTKNLINFHLKFQKDFSVTEKEPQYIIGCFPDDIEIGNKNYAFGLYYENLYNWCLQLNGKTKSIWDNTSILDVIETEYNNNKDFFWIKNVKNFGDLFYKNTKLTKEDFFITPINISIASLTLYFCKIWNDKRVLNYFIPLKKDDKYFLYDLISKNFYETKGEKPGEEIKINCFSITDPNIEKIKIKTKENENNIIELKKEDGFYESDLLECWWDEEKWNFIIKNINKIQGIHFGYYPYLIKYNNNEKENEKIFFPINDGMTDIESTDSFLINKEKAFYKHKKYDYIGFKDYNLKYQKIEQFSFPILNKNSGADCIYETRGKSYQDFKNDDNWNNYWKEQFDNKDEIWILCLGSGTSEIKNGDKTTENWIYKNEEDAKNNKFEKNEKEYNAVQLTTIGFEGNLSGKDKRNFYQATQGGSGSAIFIRIKKEDKDKINFKYNNGNIKIQQNNNNIEDIVNIKNKIINIFYYNNNENIPYVVSKKISIADITKYDDFCFVVNGGFHRKEWGLTINLQGFYDYHFKFEDNNLINAYSKAEKDKEIYRINYTQQLNWNGLKEEKIDSKFNENPEYSYKTDSNLNFLTDLTSYISLADGKAPEKTYRGVIGKPFKSPFSPNGKYGASGYDGIGWEENNNIFKGRDVNTNTRYVSINPTPGNIWILKTER